MQDEASRLDALEEQVNQLRVDIAQLFEEMKKGNGEKESEVEMGLESKNEASQVKDLTGKEPSFVPKTNADISKVMSAPTKVVASAAKKFTRRIPQCFGDQIPTRIHSAIPSLSYRSTNVLEVLDDTASVNTLSGNKKTLEFRLALFVSVTVSVVPVLLRNSQNAPPSPVAVVS